MVVPVLLPRPLSFLLPPPLLSLPPSLAPATGEGEGIQAIGHAALGDLGLGVLGTAFEIA